MFILYCGGTQMQVFTGVGRLENWIKNMPQGWTLEYTPNWHTPTVTVVYRAHNGTIITERGKEILNSFSR